jgi:glucan phosphoethanolaminetransferase (alkaline phosphatase superfamily)
MEYVTVQSITICYLVLLFIIMYAVKKSCDYSLNWVERLVISITVSIVLPLSIVTVFEVLYHLINAVLGNYN